MRNPSHCETQTSRSLRNQVTAVTCKTPPRNAQLRKAPHPGHQIDSLPPKSRCRTENIGPTERVRRYVSVRLNARLLCCIVWVQESRQSVRRVRDTCNSPISPANINRPQSRGPYPEAIRILSDFYLLRILSTGRLASYTDVRRIAEIQRTR